MPQKKSESNGSSNYDAHHGHLLWCVDKKGHISKGFYHRSAILCVFSVSPSPDLSFRHLMSTSPFFPALIYMCARRRPSHTPGSWRSSTSGRCSGIFLCAFLSVCYGHGHSITSRSPRCRATTRCRCGPGCQTSPSPGLAHRSWAIPRSTPGLVLWGVWRRRIWPAVFPPSLWTPGVSPQPSRKHCRTCLSGNPPKAWSQAEPTSRSLLHSCLTVRGTYSAGACFPGWSGKEKTLEIGISLRLSIIFKGPFKMIEK